MRTVHLYGKLAEKYGAKWRLEVASIGESLRAIEANRRGFLEDVKTGGDYFVLRGKDLQTADGLGPSELTMQFGEGDFHICPAAAGAGFGQWLQVIGGTVLAIIGLVTQQYWLVGIGVSLAVGGVTQMLTSVPEAPRQEGEKKSYLFSGPRNRAEQGVAMPLIFGGLTQPVYTGSVVVSQGIQAVEAKA